MERIKADDLYAYRFLSEVAVAPDGAHAAFVSRRARDDGKGYYACIHLLDTATGAVRPLTGNGDEAAFRWLDSNTLIFPSCRTGDQPGKTAFYRLDIRGSEAERAFTIPLSVKQFHPLPDGRWFVLTRRPMTPPEDLPADQPQPGRDYTVFDELPFWADGLGMINGTRMSGWIFDPADGSVNQITPPTYDMEGAAVSPEGSRILYWGVSFEGIRPDYRQLMLYDLATGQTRSLVPDGKYRITQVSVPSRETVSMPSVSSATSPPCCASTRRGTLPLWPPMRGLPALISLERTPIWQLSGITGLRSCTASPSPAGNRRGSPNSTTPFWRPARSHVRSTSRSAAGTVRRWMAGSSAPPDTSRGRSIPAY